MLVHRLFPGFLQRSATRSKAYRLRYLAFLGLCTVTAVSLANQQSEAPAKTTSDNIYTPAPIDAFRKLTQSELNLGHYRARNGYPAENYWQQQVDYTLSARLDPKQNRILGSAQVRYHNNSPDSLRHLYFALDHNALRPDSTAAFRLAASSEERDRSRQQFRSEAATSNAGFDITTVADADGQPLDWRVRDTLLEIKLPQPLRPDSSLNLYFEWGLPLVDKVATGARSGYETLADGSRIFVAAQWFPRAMGYTDYAGWQLKPFLQQGEFTTEFGNYDVTITVPAHYSVAASGRLENPQRVLDQTQLSSWKSVSQQPVWLVTADQAAARRTSSSNRNKRWQFSGDNLRDFAFSASPAFQWQVKRDAEGRLLQQFFPAEAAPLWERFGLAAIDHTLRTFDAALMPLRDQSISLVNAAGIGMEYPGLATVATRPERVQNTQAQPAWDALTKYDFIGSVIHEVGHNYLPMRINTDEREWAWLDEGLVSFIEYRAEHSWEANFDVIYGEPSSIAEYTAGSEHQPIMTSADSLQHKIDNAYNKTASLLNSLRYLVLDPDTFDNALAEFARTWEGKRPTPGDFFRAMETASGTDLSWFWRSWFYSAHSIDLGVQSVTLNGQQLAVVPADAPAAPAVALSAGGIETFVVDRQPALADVYTQPLPALPQTTTPLALNAAQDSNWYTLTLVNHGSGLLPIPVELQMRNGARYSLKVPAQTWMKADEGILSLHIPVRPELEVTAVCLDPLSLTPDTRRNNNCVEVQSL